MEPDAQHDLAGQSSVWDAIDRNYPFHKVSCYSIRRGIREKRETESKAKEVKISGIDFPKPLLTALRNGRLVVFAGAGVSMGEPADLPDFENLARAIA